MKRVSQNAVIAKDLALTSEARASSGGRRPFKSQRRGSAIRVDQAREIALRVAAEYSRLNARANREAWGLREYTEGFVGDVGQLTKLVMMKSGLRPGDDVDARLRHELADCLWSLLVISDTLGVDLAEAFESEMGELLVKLAAD